MEVLVLGRPCSCNRQTTNILAYTFDATNAVNVLNKVLSRLTAYVRSYRNSDALDRAHLKRPLLQSKTNFHIKVVSIFWGKNNLWSGCLQLQSFSKLAMNGARPSLRWDLRTSCGPGYTIMATRTRFFTVPPTLLHCTCRLRLSRMFCRCISG